MAGLSPVPGHLDAAGVGISELGEDLDGDVEVVGVAALAAVLDGDDGGFAAAGDLDLATAERVVVGVAVGRVGVEELPRERDDGVALGVVHAAGPEAGRVVRQVAAVASGLEGAGRGGGGRGHEAGRGGEDEGDLGEELHFFGS